MTRNFIDTVSGVTFRLMLARVSAASLRSLAVSISIRGSGAVLGLVYNIVLSRTLGPAGSGVVSFYLNMSTFLGLIATSGMDTVGLRELARYSGQPNGLSALFNNLLSNSLISGLIYFGALILFLFFFGAHFPARIDYEVYVLSAVLLIAGAFQKILSDFLIALQAYNQSQSTLYLINRLVTLFAIGISILVLHMPVVQWERFFLATYAVGVALAVLYGGINLFARLPFSFRMSKYSPSWRLFREGLSCSAQTISINILNLSPFVLLGWLSSSIELGLFSAAQRLATFLVLIVSTICQLAMRDLAFSHGQRDSAALARSLTLSLRLTIVVSSVLTLPLIVFAPFWISIFGRGFHAAAPVLAAYSAATGVLCIGMPFQAALLATNNERHARDVSIAAAVSGILFNAILIPRCGAMGAALGTGTGFALQLLGHAWYTFRTLPIRVADGILKIAPKSVG